MAGAGGPTTKQTTNIARGGLVPERETFKDFPLRSAVPFRSSLARSGQWPFAVIGSCSALRALSSLGLGMQDERLHHSAHLRMTASLEYVASVAFFATSFSRNFTLFLRQVF